MDRIYTALPVNRALISRIRIIAPLKRSVAVREFNDSRVEREQDGGGGEGRGGKKGRIFYFG